MSPPIPHSFCSPSADVDVPSPDEKSVITYVSSIYDAFPKVPEGGEGISAIVSDAAQHPDSGEARRSSFSPHRLGAACGRKELPQVQRDAGMWQC